MELDEFGRIKNLMDSEKRDLEAAEKELEEARKILEETRRLTAAEEKEFVTAFKYKDSSKMQQIKERIIKSYPRLAMVPNKIKSVFSKVVKSIQADKEEVIDLNKLKTTRT
jgi:Skp family chaperone for outer membrane proteins